MINVYLLCVLQLGQTSFSFNLSQLQQPQIQQPYTQQNLFLPATPTNPDPYQASQLPSFPQRNPPQAPYGQTPSQPSTIMVSSATSSQMTSAIKPPTQAGFGKLIILFVSHTHCIYCREIGSLLLCMDLWSDHNSRSGQDGLSYFKNLELIYFLKNPWIWHLFWKHFKRKIWIFHFDQKKILIMLYLGWMVFLVRFDILDSSLNCTYTI